MLTKMTLHIMNLWMNSFKKCLYSRWEYVLRKGKSVI